jgi:GT2 family glycosyltransferase
MAKLAVVILNYNGRKHLETFLPSVQAYSAGARVIVADNCSTDDSLAFLEAQYPEVERIILPSNTGYAGGYARALTQVNAEILVLLNSDVEVTPRWLDPIQAMFDAHPEVAALQPKILSYLQKDTFEYAGAAGGFIDTLGYPFCRGRIFDTLEKDEGQYNTPTSIFWASGACLCIRSSDYAACGGLDEDFFAHMEEIDLCWRIHRSGKNILYCPESTVYHLGGGTLAQGHPRKTFLNFRNGLFVLLKNMSISELLWKFPLRLGVDAVAAWKFLLCGYPRDFLAVAKAHFATWWSIRTIWKKRSAVRFSPDVEEIPGKYTGSIVWSYYVRKKRRFTEIWKD